MFVFWKRLRKQRKNNETEKKYFQIFFQLKPRKIWGCPWLFFEFMFNLDSTLCESHQRSE